MDKIVDTIFFSPTESTKKIAMAVADGLGYSINVIDITRPHIREQEIKLSADAIILAVPVYEEFVPELLLPIFSNLNGDGRPAIIITVYGNIHSGRALYQLNAMASNCGFRVIAAAAFVAEHSFSSDASPVAAGRPNDTDLLEAAEFGRSVRKKIASGNASTISIAKEKLSLMTKMLPKNSAKLLTIVPKADNSICVSCGVCAKVCPAAAIDPNSFFIDPKLCMRCFACVKRCAYSARSIKFRSPLVSLIFFRLGAHSKKNILYF